MGMFAVVSALDIDMSAIEPTGAEPVAEVCYRHSDRETGVTCQRCDRLVCGECAAQASVGVHCPECRKSNKQKVYTARSLPGDEFYVTKALVGLNVAVFVVTIVFFGATATNIGREALEYSTFGPLIAEEFELWRIISGGFLHDGLIHIGFNMYLLWRFGRELEQKLGWKEYLATYMAALVGGSFGAVLISPTTPVVGASGAVFGLMAVLVVLNRSRGIALLDSNIGFLVLLNGFFSFRAGVSLGGHLGGFLVGLLLGAIFFGMNPGEGPILGAGSKRLVLVVAIGLVLFGATFAAATTWMSPLF